MKDRGLKREYKDRMNKKVPATPKKQTCFWSERMKLEAGGARNFLFSEASKEKQMIGV